LIALAPGNINDADADGHGRKNKDENSGAKGVDETMSALSSLCDTEGTAWAAAIDGRISIAISTRQERKTVE